MLSAIPTYVRSRTYYGERPEVFEDATEYIIEYCDDALGITIARKLQ